MSEPADFVHQLDARQRAMLKAMGITVWAPTPTATHSSQASAEPLPVRVANPTEPTNPFEASAAAPIAVPQSPMRPTRAPIVPAPAAAPAATTPVPRPPLLAEALSGMDADALSQTIATCQACALCIGRRHAVSGQGHMPADWMVVGDALGDAEDEHGQVFMGDEGVLLDNMLRAVGRSRHESGSTAAYVTTALKCRPLIGQKPSAESLTQCAVYLQRQVALVRPRVIVLMGSLATQAVLGSSEPLGRLRGRVHHFEGVPVIVTYPLRHLLSTPESKAKAWDDLCLAWAQLTPAP